MSFMVNHDGVLYEKNLGAGTDAAARAMTRFDPDAGWRKGRRAVGAGAVPPAPSTQRGPN